MPIEDAATQDALIHDLVTASEDSAAPPDSGLEDRNAEDGGHTDAAFPPWIISQAKLAPTTSYSHVDLDVDWQAELAYISSRQSQTCVSVVDFNLEASPTMVHRLGPSTDPATAGGVCIGLQLFSANRRLIVSLRQGVLETWSLGSDPRSLGFTLLSRISVGGYIHRVAVSEGEGSSVVYVAGGALVQNVRRYELAADGTFSQDPPQVFAAGCSSNDLAFNDDVVVTGCWANDSPAVGLHPATVEQSWSLDMTYGDSSGFWCADVAPDGSVFFLGGWISAFLLTDGTPLLRFDNPSVYRDAVFVQNGPPKLFAAMASGQLDVWSLAASTPVLESASTIPVEGELYAVEVDLTSRRAIVVSNRGDFLIVDLDALQPTLQVYDTF